MGKKNKKKHWQYDPQYRHSQQKKQIELNTRPEPGLSDLMTTVLAMSNPTIPMRMFLQNRPRNIQSTNLTTYRYNLEDDPTEAQKKWQEQVKATILVGMKQMPILARSCLAREFIAEMQAKMPYTAGSEIDKWKEEYSLGVIKISWPEIYQQLEGIPGTMRGQMARIAMEQQIMPALSGELTGSLGWNSGIGQLANALLTDYKGIPPTELLEEPNTNDDWNWEKGEG